METLGFTIPKLVIGVIVQVLCSYSTLPLYALVTQMGSHFKQGIFDELTQEKILAWARRRKTGSTAHLATLPFESITTSDRPAAGISSTIQLSHYPNPV
ncbi:unnamed protein product [Cuscuta campestris]|uniref:MLO-like protein n=1 Tax=Cuscuta campestris TaxID=132261 RepID=A0A484M7M5_9ASTE|nr:unnamed protein product [Cuscuta campestris]